MRRMMSSTVSAFFRGRELLAGARGFLAARDFARPPARDLSGWGFFTRAGGVLASPARGLGGRGFSPVLRARFRAFFARAGGACVLPVPARDARGLLFGIGFPSAGRSGGCEGVRHFEQGSNGVGHQFSERAAELTFFTEILECLRGEAGVLHGFV